ncbi:MAG: hypothetical protein R3B82_29285 [Sandaracinaceae bacterium]
MRNTMIGLVVALTSFGCDGTSPPGGDGGSSGGGDLTVILEAEDTITAGIEAGATGEAIQDGWSVTFDRYVVVIGGIAVAFSTDPSVTASAPELYAVDLVAAPEAGLPLWSIPGLDGGRWELGYRIGTASEATLRHDSVTPTELEEMTAGGWTYLIEGAMAQAGGQSCPPAALATPGGATPNGNTNAGGDACYDAPSIAFRWGLTAPTSFGPCEIDATPGFAITEGSTTTVAATIHGDHVFFNGFPESTESSVMRLAQWLADCDLDLDGTVTREELEAIAPADLAELDARFELGGSPVTPLVTMWDYVSAQVKTQGHFQGEGECAIGPG